MTLGYTSCTEYVFGKHKEIPFPFHHVDRQFERIDVLLKSMAWFRCLFKIKVYTDEWNIIIKILLYIITSLIREDKTISGQ